MKRFHVHTHVQDLAASVQFYSHLFGAAPSRLEGDYAKWMLEDPRLNFAISSRANKAGVDHLGFQADTPEELAELKARAQAADAGVKEEGLGTCCYARSDKHWVTDPQGIAWEHFQTLDTIPVFSENMAAYTPFAANAASAANDKTADLSDTACCAPRTAVVEPTGTAARGKPVGIAVKAAASCC